MVTPTRQILQFHLGIREMVLNQLGQSLGRKHGHPYNAKPHYAKGLTVLGVGKSGALKHTQGFVTYYIELKIDVLLQRHCLSNS